MAEEDASPRGVHALRRCPQCVRPYRDYPALSRWDNRTEICPACGLAEAMEDAVRAGVLTRPTAAQIIKEDWATHDWGDMRAMLDRYQKTHKGEGEEGHV